jgi:hypothetical protein
LFLPNESDGLRTEHSLRSSREKVSDIGWERLCLEIDSKTPRAAEDKGEKRSDNVQELGHTTDGFS